MSVINKLESLFNGKHVRDNSNHQDLLTLLPPKKNEVSKLYLHLFRDYKSTVTGFLREHLLSWRWKGIYVTDEKGFCAKVLVSKGSQEGNLPRAIERLLGKTPFETALILNGSSSIGKQKEEFLFSISNDRVAHIFRARSLASKIGYQFLKFFSREWKEVTLTVSNLSEKILLKKADEHDLRLFPNIVIN